MLISLLVTVSLSFAASSAQAIETGTFEKKDKVEVEGSLIGLPVVLPPQAPQLDFPVERVQLDNGMVFLLHSQRTIPLVSYHTWFRVGARDELKGESGLAHMFEHMMFKGTLRFPNKEFDRILQANGIVNNAFTTQDYTGYYEILPSSKLEMIMDMEADRMQSLQIVNDEFMKEREVVKEERRMRYENDPGGMGWEKLNSLVFQGNKYALPVIGTMQEINAFDVEKLTRFYKKWYVPSNAVVAIVGDFDPIQLKKWIKTYYGSIKSPPRPSREALSLSSEVKAQEAQVSFPVQSPEILWGAPTIKSGSDDAFALDLLSVIFGQGKSSHLFTELIYKKQMALSAVSSHYSMQESGMFIVQAVAKPGVSADRLQKALSDLFARFLKEPIQAEELVKAKNILLSDYLDSLKTTDGKARLLALNEVMLGDYREFFRDMERYLKVSLKDLQRVKSYLAADKFSQVIVASGKGGKSR